MFNDLYSTVTMFAIAISLAVFALPIIAILATIQKCRNYLVIAAMLWGVDFCFIVICLITMWRKSM